MKRICLLILFVCFNLHLFAGEPPQPLVVDTARIAWVENGFIGEYARTLMVGFKSEENLKTIIVDQWDDGATFPQEFYVTDFAEGFFSTIVDTEYDTRFVLTAFNDFGNTQTEFILHPKEITKTVTLGVEKVSMPKTEIATVYSTAGRMVWRGSSADVERALRNLPKGVYVVKDGKAAKKVFR